MQNQPMTKHSGLQGHHLILYKRALHPELFSLKQRRSISHGGYELEAWLMQGAHMLRFQLKHFCASELVTAQESGLPTTGVVTTFPCLGERDYDHPFPDAGVKYTTTMQTETLSENLYESTYKEMLVLAQETDAIMHTWTEAEGQGMSMIELQRYAKEVHAQAYHLSPSTGLVLRTQTIFEHGV
jgi:hypothetical protein